MVYWSSFLWGVNVIVHVEYVQCIKNICILIWFKNIFLLVIYIPLDKSYSCSWNKNNTWYFSYWTSVCFSSFWSWRFKNRAASECSDLNMIENIYLCWSLISDCQVCIIPTFHSFLIRSNGGTLNAYIVFLDGIGCINGHWNNYQRVNSLEICFSFLLSLSLSHLRRNVIPVLSFLSWIFFLRSTINESSFQVRCTNTVV